MIYEFLILNYEPVQPSLINLSPVDFEFIIHNSKI